MKPLFAMPDPRHPDFLQQLIHFGHFLEKQTRPGCPHDLRQCPNKVWQLIEARMLEGWRAFLAAEVGDKQLLMLQWYNSGVFIKTAGQIIAFDLLPIPRFYDWSEPPGLTAEIAENIDALLITHNHQDHYDFRLVDACLQRGCPVIMHPAAVDAVRGGHSSMQVLPDLQSVELGSVAIRAVHCCHVWRQSAAELPLCAFEVTFADYFRLLFCGDADYTKGFSGVEPGCDAVFITWRNPGPDFEDGHPAQKAATIDAVNIMRAELQPRQVILQHYGELDHVYKGFTASYDLAATLLAKLGRSASIHFWGDIHTLKT